MKHIINDYTFAVRLKAFVKEVKVHDPMSQEEKDYLICTAEKLIATQHFLGTDYHREYLKRCKQ